MEVNTIERPGKEVRSEKQLITFSQKDEVGVIYTHDDPLVITMVVANYQIKRVLVDTGSFADVMYYATFQQLNIEENPIEVFAVEVVDVRDEDKFIQGERVESLVEMELEPGRPDRMVKIGVALNLGIQKELMDFLRGYKDVFAWSHDDTPGIDSRIISHRLSINPNHRPVKPKKRTFVPERNRVTTEEVKKLGVGKT
ncbi:hypothetical protein Vadar_000281 [Vaccinium darrowii]|uniref:Uncharacterized protein n=1 Tax=Vaccinium darrowii TaxID=229202 RepID=A0ACB7YAU0_9ERIC|nr:hypothetical protein Vadar_000281 [Vaccinium darrowii]